MQLGFAQTSFVFFYKFDFDSEMHLNLLSKYTMSGSESPFKTHVGHIHMI